MRIKLEIDLSLSPRSRWVIAWVLTPVAVLAGSGAVAHAWTGGLTTAWIQQNAPVSATSLKGLLDQTDQRLNALENKSIESRVATYTVGGETLSYSLGAVYVKPTEDATPGDMSGLAGVQAYKAHFAAKKACEMATSSKSAHMCTGDEIARSAALGVAPPSTIGWYTTQFRIDTGNMSNGDCDGWRNADVNHAGHVGAAPWSPSSQTCDKPLPVLCCD